jgi:hypothetical protein
MRTNVDPAAPDARIARDVPGRRVADATIASVVAALFVHPVVAGFYGGLERELPDEFPILSALLLPFSLVAWFSLYCRKREVRWVMDMGWFVMSAWVFIIPYYILKREGRAGLSRIGLFCLTWFAAWATGRAVFIWMRVMAAD